MVTTGPSSRHPLNNRRRRQDASDGTGGAESVVDTHDHQPGGARGQHGQQGGHPTQAGPVSACAGRDGHDRSGAEAPDDAGQSPLHARHDHDDVGGLQQLQVGEQPVQPRHPGVGHQGGAETEGSQS